MNTTQIRDCGRCEKKTILCSHSNRGPIQPRAETDTVRSPHDTSFAESEQHDDN